MSRVVTYVAIFVAIAALGTAGFLWLRLHPGYVAPQAEATPANAVRTQPATQNDLEMRERQQAAMRSMRETANFFLLGRERGEWLSKNNQSLKCGVNGSMRYLKNLLTDASEKEQYANLPDRPFEKKWLAAGCEVAAPMKNPNSPYWHAFPDDIGASQILSATRTMLDSSLNDYPAARFRNVSIHYTGRGDDKRFAVCGEINPVNRMNAHIGWRQFGTVSQGDHYKLILPGDNLQGLSETLILMKDCGEDRTGWVSGDKDYSRAITR